MSAQRSRRRALLVAATCVAALPITARAQSKKSPVVIGWLSTFADDPDSRDLPNFKDALAALGRRDGVDVVIEARWAGTGNPERLRRMAAELAAKKPAAIVTYVGSATLAAAAAGIPIVQAQGGSPVQRGLAASYARPGGLVTGMTNLSIEISEKYTELVFDLVPGIQRIGYLRDASVVNVARSQVTESAERAARRFNARAVIVDVTQAAELESAFAQFHKHNVQAAVVLPSAWFPSEGPRIAQLALRQQLPSVSSPRAADRGALLGYGFDISYNFRRAAWYVDQILKGVKPGELPIEQPSKFELVVNRKTAMALGITVPPVIMVRADRVID